MKYAVIIYDGMADYPVPALGGKTPMELAKKPVFDSLARRGRVGLVKTVADGLKPGSDVANLSVLGYDPKIYYTGRSPIEAAGLGIKMDDDDVAIRCNLVSLSREEGYENKTMTDYSAGDVSTAEAAEIIKAVQENLGNDEFSFHLGTGYRHCLIWRGGVARLEGLTPPHDITGRVIGEYLSTDPRAAKLADAMKKSYDFLDGLPVNQKREAEGKLPANSIWLWGEGKKTVLPPFEKLFGLKGAVVSAVDLLKGIAALAEMDAPRVEGATAYIDTNFEGKAEAAVREWESGADFVYVHIEATDECGHRNEPENKVKAIELIDQRVLPIILDYLDGRGEDYKVMILPDHATPIVTRTHASDPVPFMIYRKNGEIKGKVDSINENTAKSAGDYVPSGPGLMREFLKGDRP